jgi:hypothetical protein
MATGPQDFRKTNSFHVRIDSEPTLEANAEFTERIDRR